MGAKRRLSWLVMIATIGVLLAQELRKPAAQRTWHGRLVGFVPYDLRPPTIERMGRAWWNPDDDRLITGMVWGIGWSVNLGRLARMIGLA